MRFAQLPRGGRFVFTTLLVLSVCTLGFPGLSVTSLEAATRARVDSRIIERIFGVRGQWKGDVFQVTFPRKSRHVGELAKRGGRWRLGKPPRGVQKAGGKETPKPKKRSLWSFLTRK